VTQTDDILHRHLLLGLCVFSVLGAMISAGHVSGVTAQSVQPSIPDPRLFRIAPKNFPWQTRELLRARVESNNHADGDAIVIYDWTQGTPSWALLQRSTGWYESAIMHRGSMQPSVAILVSEYASSEDAARAFKYENRFESYRPPRSHPKLGSESVEYANSTLSSFLGGTSRVEDSIIYTRYQNVELDVAVFDAHAPKYHWEVQYRKAALTLARRLVSKAVHVLPLETGSSTPTPTALPSPTVASGP